ncbi:unnamed protein product [Didymodactylos carnosus]|uniref:Uncharacterized protein n=1 Tax=Didymodactylos carnosus TaxID=1234261 RepID=A0A8S2E3F8_9BILA|nr:unnamed protein product [Didymodactylos carnosus]CAF3835098.1 unnamed protein product [Didymodactylos carnosus]
MAVWDDTWTEDKLLDLIEFKYPSKRHATAEELCALFKEKNHVHSLLRYLSLCNLFDQNNKSVRNLDLDNANNRHRFCHLGFMWLRLQSVRQLGSISVTSTSGLNCPSTPPTTSISTPDGFQTATTELTPTSYAFIMSSDNSAVTATNPSNTACASVGTRGDAKITTNVAKVSETTTMTPTVSKMGSADGERKAVPNAYTLLFLTISLFFLAR